MENDKEEPKGTFSKKLPDPEQILIPDKKKTILEVVAIREKIEKQIIKHDLWYPSSWPIEKVEIKLNLDYDYNSVILNFGFHGKQKLDWISPSHLYL